MSVQQRLEQALHQLTGAIHRVHSSGRTDAGVHALGMVCHLTTERDLPLSAWREGLNRFLPDDIAIRKAEYVDDEFHARFSAQGKRYRYTILRDSVRLPLQRKTSWQVKQPLVVTGAENNFDIFRERKWLENTNCTNCKHIKLKWNHTLL